MFGFTGAFGGTLMDDSGKCVADQAGFADAFKYFQDLKAAGAKYYTDGNALKQDFQTGKLQAVIDGPWQTADFAEGARRQARRRDDARRRPRPPTRSPGPTASTSTPTARTSTSRSSSRSRWSAPPRSRS